MVISIALVQWEMCWCQQQLRLPWEFYEKEMFIHGCISWRIAKLWFQAVMFQIYQESFAEDLRKWNLESSEELSHLSNCLSRCPPISPFAISPNQWFWVRVSHPVYIEIVLAGEMGMNRLSHYVSCLHFQQTTAKSKHDGMQGMDGIMDNEQMVQRGNIGAKGNLISSW